MSAVTVRTVGERTPGRWARGDLAMTISLIVSVLAGGAVAVLGLLREPSAVPVGAIFPGVISVVSGAVLLIRGATGPTRARYRQLLGLALIVWGIGQLWNGIAVTVGTPVFPTVGDVISLVAAPIAVAGTLSVPRRSEGAHPGFRLGLDSLLLGVTLALLCWHVVFAGIFADGPFRASDLLAVVVLVADVTIVCVATLAWIRDLDHNLLLTSIGAACYSVGDLATMHSTLQDPGNWPWPAAVLWCLAWPLIVTGLLRYDPVPLTPEAAGTPVDPDARGVMITTAVSLALLLLSVGAVAISGGDDRVSLALIAVAVAVFWARDLLNARFRSELLRRLHDEATADPLTGLANRRVLAGRMAALPEGEPWCLLTVDLDGFKDVNDLLGHATGDKLLAAVAQRLLEASPPEALVSRLGGDEFAVLLPGGIEVGTRVGSLIVTAVRQSAADVEGVARVEVSASIGVAAVDAAVGAGNDRSHTARAETGTTSGTGGGSGTGGSGGRAGTGTGTGAGGNGTGGSGGGAGTGTGTGTGTGSGGGAGGNGTGGSGGAGTGRGSGGRAGTGTGAGTGDQPGPSGGSQGTPAKRRVIDLADAGRVADAALAASDTLPNGTPVVVAGAEPPARPAPPTVVDPLGALSASGAALRMAKAGGRNRVEVYDADVARARQRRLRVEERLRAAVEHGDITVSFQPIVDLRRGVMAGAEALARWTDDELGRVGPEEFITVAEQTGMVVAIGEHILEQTLSQAVSEGLFARGLRLSCNVSPVQLRVAGFHQVVAEAMASHNVAREQLVIEVTEQVLVEEGQAAQTLHRLAGLGVTIAIDDFGTGYSALGYLQRLPADILKIDRSLTSSLVAEPRSRAITRAVLDLGRTVGVSVVVEGVESSQVDDLVRRMGVGFGQGLHYGAAMPAAELAAMADRMSGTARVS